MGDVWRWKITLAAAATQLVRSSRVVRTRHLSGGGSLEIESFWWWLFWWLAFARIVCGFVGGCLGGLFVYLCLWSVVGPRARTRNVNQTISTRSHISYMSSRAHQSRKLTFT